MSITEQHVTLAARLYAARNTYRALRGDRWRIDLAPIMDAIQKRAKADGTDAIKAGMAIAKGLQERFADCGGTVLAVLAGIVELVEPTPVTA